MKATIILKSGRDITVDDFVWPEGPTTGLFVSFHRVGLGKPSPADGSRKDLMVWLLVDEIAAVVEEA